MIYKTIEVKFWNDKEIKKLSVDARFLFLYFMTNRQVHHSGLYEIPLPTLLYETGFTEAKFNKALVELQEKPFVLRDPETDLILVVNMMMYSLKVGNKENLIKGITKQMSTLHDSHLLASFHSKYKDLAYPLPMGYEWVNDPSNIVIDIDMGIGIVIVKNDKGEKHKHGEYKHVLLTDEQFEKLQERFADCNERIKRLDEYLQIKSVTYKDHYLVICQWAKKDKVQNKGSVNAKEDWGNSGEDGTNF